MWTILWQDVLTGQVFCASPSPLPSIKSCCKMKFLSGPGQSWSSYGTKSLWYEPLSRKKKEKHVKAATSVRRSLLLGCSERGNYISQNPWGLSNRKGRESKQKSKSPGLAETTSRRVMENKSTSRGLESVAGWLINISTKPASPLFSLFELHPIFFAIPAGAIVNPHSSPPQIRRKHSERPHYYIWNGWMIGEV